MADYKFFKNITGTANAGVIYKSKEMTREKWIPLDPGNTDYQIYLEWAKSHTTDPAD